MLWFTIAVVPVTTGGVTDVSTMFVPEPTNHIGWTGDGATAILLFVSVDIIIPTSTATPIWMLVETSAWFKSGESEVICGRSVLMDAVVEKSLQKLSSSRSQIGRASCRERV